MNSPKYCLDTNVLIEAWHKYYNPSFCPDYWKVLDELGRQGTIFIPESVLEEITKVEDELSVWLQNSNIPVKKITEQVTSCLVKIYETNPNHKYLINSVKSRSLADPWVIAHGLNESAIVVTKEAKITTGNPQKIKIPNVCENMGLRWINDFEFIAELNIQFTCTVC
ncbi:MAG: DUF4411 family protein [Clostridiales bacterium]